MAAVTKKEDGVKTVPGIRVRTTRAGFRRGGREWSGTTEVPVSDLTKEQLKQIREEDMLVVDDIDIELADKPGNE